MKNEKGKTSFYVINYDEGGFVLLSADKRVQPIIGYAEEGEFIVDQDSYPLGLEFWINDAKKQITDIQNSSIEQTENDKLAWSKIQILSTENSESITGRPPTDPDEPGGDPCYAHTVSHTTGPLLSSRWYQTGGFNDALPNITCDGNNFQVYAGCVPIAMGQIMKYHEYPTSYNWSAMPLTYGTTTTASFIEDIHDAIGNVYNGQPFYECDGTGVSASSNMGNVLKSQFNYSSASWGSYNFGFVKANIAVARPVLLSGDNGQTGHMWVCDGYRATTYYFENCGSVGYLYFNMNWGWYGGSNNGWFSFDNFNPGNTNYNNNKKMIYNIMP